MSYNELCNVIIRRVNYQRGNPMTYQERRIPIAIINSYHKYRAYFIGMTIAACGMIRGCSSNNKYWIPTDFNITPLHESSFISHYWNSYETVSFLLSFFFPALISLSLSLSPLFHFRHHPNPAVQEFPC